MSGAERLTRRGALAGIGAAAVLTLATRAGAAAADPIARAPAGDFVGERDGATAAFRGIRYGRAARFHPPVAVPMPGEAIVARRFGPVCPQRDTHYQPQSEDCLFLNVWTPEAAPGGGRPVMVYIHGGAYSNGSSTDPLNDGRRLAEAGDVVVVTVNHRLNAFGYLYLQRLDPRYPDSGNAGQLDLVLALEWIRENVAAFGGDPSRVMVFGQSGGGAKIATMMGMPAATGLFHRAATMSGQQVTVSGPLNATARARTYLARLGIDDDDVARVGTIPAAAMVEALDAVDPILGGGVYFGPVLDMRSLYRHPFWPDANPLGLGIPMILGNTHDETRAFIAADSPRLQGLDWGNLADRMAPELRIDILPEWVVAEYRARYPAWSPRDVFYDATTAGRSWRGQVIEAEERAAAGHPAWVYQLDFASRTDPARGAFHTMDIPLAFGTLDAPGSQTGTGADARSASDALQRCFVAFARSGDPAHVGVPSWPRYTTPLRATLIVDAQSRVESDPRRWQRELFSRVPYIQPGT